MRLERPLVFAGNDRPGVMLADAARVYLRRYGVKAGTRAVIATTDDSAYAAGVALQEAGVVIAAVADLRAEASDAAHASGLPIRSGASVVATGGQSARQSRDTVEWRRHRLRSGADVRRLDSVGASLFAVARQAAVR